MSGNGGDQQQPLFIQEAMADFNDLFEIPLWTYDLLSERIMPLMPSPEHYTSIMGAVVKCQERGMSISSPEFKRGFGLKCREYLNMTLNRLDPMSRAASMVTSKSNNPFRPFLYCTNYELLAPFLNANHKPSSGRFGVTIGPPFGKALGIGKTNTTLLALERGHEVGFKGAANILYEGEYPWLTEVLSLKDLIKTAILNLTDKEDPAFTLAVIDGTPQFFRRERAMSKVNVVMSQVGFLNRKVGINEIFVAQREERIPDEVLQMSMWTMMKYDTDKLRLEVTDPTGNRFATRYRDVPETRIKYETGDFETFEAEFDIAGMHSMLSKMKKEERMGTGQLQAILDFLDRDSMTLTKQDRMTALKTIYINSKGPKGMDLSYQDMSDLVGCGKNSVRPWLTDMGILSAES